MSKCNCGGLKKQLAGEWTQFIRCMEGRLLSTFVSLNLKYEMLVYVTKGDSLLSILLSEDGVNGSAISMSNADNKTLCVLLHEIFCLCHLGLI